MGDFEVKSTEAYSTGKDRWVKILSPRRRILLQITWVIVEGPIFTTGLEGASILNHLGVEEVEMFMWDHVFHDDEAI
ncbi:Uu.00g070380.m01.CDS01 [Anthostomella pinea]|uniref:Uu.00g070380.m01.CDS01 n=1 Tax=Anthostomella pinea TaxID=933095 RepID=A0AAI8VVW6_9PEZI|nr:Uu.00g070380.m01.CDS01 [Anthostomella pinea]